MSRFRMRPGLSCASLRLRSRYPTSSPNCPPHRRLVEPNFRDLGSPLKMTPAIGLSETGRLSIRVSRLRIHSRRSTRHRRRFLRRNGMTHRATPTGSSSSTRTSHRRMNRRQALPKRCDAPRCATTVFLVGRRSSFLRGIAIHTIQGAPLGKGFVRRRRRGHASSGMGLGSPGSTPVSTKRSDRWSVVK